MFDIFKKNPEPETTGVPQTAELTPTTETPPSEASQVPEPIQIVETPLAVEAPPVVEALLAVEAPPVTEESRESVEDSLPMMLEKLDDEVRMLLTEKQQLVDIQEKLHVKLAEEVAQKRFRIEHLKGEVPELRQKCENLARALGIQVCS